MSWEIVILHKVPIQGTWVKVRNQCQDLMLWISKIIGPAYWAKARWFLLTNSVKHWQTNSKKATWICIFSEDCTCKRTQASAIKGDWTLRIGAISAQIIPTDHCQCSPTRLTWKGCIFIEFKFINRRGRPFCHETIPFSASRHQLRIIKHIPARVWAIQLKHARLLFPSLSPPLLLFIRFSQIPKFTVIYIIVTKTLLSSYHCGSWIQVG